MQKATGKFITRPPIYVCIICLNLTSLKATLCTCCYVQAMFTHRESSSIECINSPSLGNLKYGCTYNTFMSISDSKGNNEKESFFSASFSCSFLLKFSSRATWYRYKVMKIVYGVIIFVFNLLFLFHTHSQLACFN